VINSIKGEVGKSTYQAGLLQSADLLGALSVLESNFRFFKPPIDGMVTHLQKCSAKRDAIYVSEQNSF